MRAEEDQTCFHHMREPAIAKPMLCARSPNVWMMAPLRLMFCFG